MKRSAALSVRPSVLSSRQSSRHRREPLTAALAATTIENLQSARACGAQQPRQRPRPVAGELRRASQRLAKASLTYRLPDLGRQQIAPVALPAPHAVSVGAPTLRVALDV